MPRTKPTTRTIRSRKLLLTAAFAVAGLSAGAAVAQEGETESANNAFADVEYEWATFEDTDIDNSGYVESGEYWDYAFGQADWDGDGQLEDTEWAAYTEYYYDPVDMAYHEFTYYDTNGDGYLDEVEFQVLSEGLWGSWDDDADDRLDREDWDRVTVLYADREQEP